MESYSSLSEDAPYYMNSTVSPYNTTLSEGDTFQRDFWRGGLFGLGGACVACVGVVCNIMAMVVLAHFRNKSSAPFLLICLALSDSAYLVSMLFLENISLMVKGGFVHKSYISAIGPFYCVLYPVPFIFQTLTAYLVLIITLERYTVVSWPFQAQRLCSIRSAAGVVVVVVISSVLYHIPDYMAYTCSYIFDNSTQSKKLRFYRTSFGNGHFYTQVYWKWINLVVNFLIPFVVLLIFNLLMLKALRRSRRNSTGCSQRRGTTDSRLTVMVICMTVMFFVFELLAAISLILVSGYNKYQALSPVVHRYTAVADLSLMLNSAINFVIYCFTGKKFRDTFRQMLHIRCSPISICLHHRFPQMPYPQDASTRSSHSMARFSDTGLRSTKLFSSVQLDKSDGSSDSGDGGLQHNCVTSA